MPEQQQMHAWPPFVVTVPDAAARLEAPEHVAVPEGEAVLYWCAPNAMIGYSARHVFVRLFNTAIAQLLIEKNLVPDAPAGLTFDEIDRWVTATRDLAERWPYGAAKRDLLQRAAEAVEKTFVLRDYIKRNEWPTTPARIQQFRTSLAWWSVEEFRTGLAAVLGTSRMATSAGRFAETLVADGVINLDLPDFAPDGRAALEKALASGSLERRIRECGQRIRPGADAQVMAWGLHDALLFPSADGCGDCGRFEIRARPAPRGSDLVH